MVDNPVIPMLNHPDAAPSCTVFGDRLIPRQQPLHSLDKARTRAFLMEFGSPRLHLPSAMEHAKLPEAMKQKIKQTDDDYGWAIDEKLSRVTRDLLLAYLKKEIRRESSLI